MFVDLRNPNLMYVADAGLTVTVTIINDQTGHHVPTDSPLRQKNLLVNVTDSEGNLPPDRLGQSIPAMGKDVTEDTFETSEVSETFEVFVDVELLYRRAFIKLMDQKGWEVPDIVMEQQGLTVMGE